jgi:AcrR family transcriptional regulator
MYNPFRDSKGMERMARTQAADYEARRAEIVEKAAELYAERGFLGASVADLALACRTSKSLIYHYYPSKEDILFEVMHSHVRSLLDTAEETIAAKTSAADTLRALTQAFMAHYVGAAARQRVLLNDLDRLPKPKRAIIVGIQRRLVEIVEDLLAELRTELGPRAALRWPSAMLYFGMINWTHTWMDAEGAVKPARIARLAANIFLDGLTKADLAR